MPVSPPSSGSSGSSHSVEHRPSPASELKTRTASAGAAGIQPRAARKDFFRDKKLEIQEHKAEFTTKEKSTLFLSVVGIPILLMAKPSKFYSTVVEGKTVYLPTSIPIAITEEIKEMFTGMAKKDGTPLSKSELQQVLNARRQLIHLRNSIGSKEGIIELSSKTALSPLPMMIDLETGHVFIRSSQMFAHGGQKAYREMLIIDDRGRYVQAAEYRAVAKSVGPAKMQRVNADLKKEEDFLEANDFGPHVIRGALFGTEKEKAGFTKYTYIVPRADTFTPDFEQWLIDPPREGFANKFFGGFVNMAKGLQAMHEKNIVHRDIKSSQGIIINGEVKLGDLGFSYSLDHPPASLELAGTRGYIAPECFRPTKAPQGKQQDLYAFGVMLSTTLDILYHEVSSFEYEAVKGLAQKLKSTNPEDRGTTADLVLELERIKGLIRR